MTDICDGNSFPKVAGGENVLYPEIGWRRLRIGRRNVHTKETIVNIYVGNLSFDIGDDELRAAFEEFGAVDSAVVVKDRFTGKSRGFGFVEMNEQTEAEAAIEGLNGKEVEGRELRVNEARPREDRRGGGRF
jgi:RNA recognition motif-containing protein